MSNYRDQLAAILAEHLYDRGPVVMDWPADEQALWRNPKAGNDWSVRGAKVQRLRREKAADAAILAGWRPPARVIETPEELEALRPGVVVIELDDNTPTDPEPAIWVRVVHVEHGGLYWEEPGGPGGWDAGHINLPVIVLHEPTTPPS